MVLDLQPVTTAPLKKQGPIPMGDWDMAISWGRYNRVMQLKIPILKDTGEEWEWHFKECGGRSVITGCDPVGRINIKASAEQQGNMIRFWRPADAITHLVVEGTLLNTAPKPHYRLCFFIERKLWRVLDENPQSPNFRHLELGQGYIGDWKMNWNERGSHLFHNDRVIKDPQGIFHLYDSLLTKL